ncbi:hypothetical protein Q5741_19875 [Paenibacillus sp. JX-17]|uniref:Phosphoribosylanthranilate isomerase n=1 Tax=Paenibacillus lacisoli TaxID=3064525 RepID=A0ABT9CLX9_9BACL|nr:hypothetical protein [Paenibacillus sp. JX-17]MDO7908651.1 hypothetical protein [Paenibacillus sp. JX-17]
MKSEVLYEEFLRITAELQQQLKITPVLYGSLGLERATEMWFAPQDIDILVPERYIREDWTMLQEVMEGVGYVLTDLHEHKFKKSDLSESEKSSLSQHDYYEVGFAYEEDLLPFAGISPEELKVIADGPAPYRLLSAQQYLEVYNRSSQDSYRRDKNNDKDLDKIERIQSWIHENNHN